MRSTPSAFAHQVLGKHHKAISSRPARKGNRPIVRYGADKHGVGSNAGPISLRGAFLRGSAIAVHDPELRGREDPDMAASTIKWGALGAALVLGSSQAWACPPPPPGPPPPAPQAGESPESLAARNRAWLEERELEQRLAEVRTQSFREGWEAALWSTSERIVLAEIIEVGEVTNQDSFLRGTPELKLRVIQVQRGPEQPGPFTLTYAGLTSCGPVGLVNVVRGQVGDRFVIFARSGELSTPTSIGAYSRADAQDSRTTSLLAGHILPAYQ